METESRGPRDPGETLRNAASFLDVEDKPIAERLLLQGQRLYGGAIWSERLGRLYAAAVLGSNRFMLGNVVSSTDSAVARGAYAARAKATLDASTDPALLTNAASYLVRHGLAANDINGRELARAYLDRALQIEGRLIRGLLQYGERETVIRYFERSAERRPADRERLQAAATAIRNGKLPSNYERRQSPELEPRTPEP